VNELEAPRESRRHIATNFALLITESFGPSSSLFHLWSNGAIFFRWEYWEHTSADADEHFLTRGQNESEEQTMRRTGCATQHCASNPSTCLKNRHDDISNKRMLQPFRAPGRFALSRHESDCAVTCPKEQCRRFLPWGLQFDTRLRLRSW
jgi:hypothetical protein